MDDNIQVKKCSKCGDVKPVSEFYRQSAAKDGFRVWCKKCEKDLSKKRYYKNRKTALIKMKIYRDNNKEKKSIIMKEWRKKNRDRIKKYGEKARDNLTDAYIKTALQSKYNVITQELVELKRAQILINRANRSQK